MAEITLVTAYFNIGRGSWSGFNRDDEKYLSYFSHWARIKTPLIIYTTPDIAEKALDIRRTYDLDNKTTVIPIPDVSMVQLDLYHAIKSVMQNRESWLFHKKLNHPESWNYDYNYVTGLKPYWVQDAISRGLTNGMTAWIDFGYDHGGEDFPYSEDFDFLWAYPFEPKIHIFLAKELDDKPIFRIVQHMDTYTRGNITIASDPLWKLLWHDTADAIRVLAECGLADDDQTLMVMAYRRHPERFITHMTSYWGQALRDYGGEKLRLRPQKPHRSSSARHKIRARIEAIRSDWDISRRHGRSIEEKYFK